MSETCFSQISPQRYCFFRTYANNFVAKDAKFVSMQQIAYILQHLCYVPFVSPRHIFITKCTLSDVFCTLACILRQASAISICAWIVM